MRGKGAALLRLQPPELWGRDKWAMELSLVEDAMEIDLITGE